MPKILWISAYVCSLFGAALVIVSLFVPAPVLQGINTTLLGAAIAVTSVCVAAAGQRVSDLLTPDNRD